MRADGRPSGSTVASVIACAFRMSARASFSQLSRSGSGSSGSSVGRAGLITLFLQEGKRARHVRRTDGRRRMEIGRVDRGKTIDPEEPETEPDLLLQELEDPHEPGLARGGETAARETPQPDCLSAERYRFYDVCSAHERAGDDDRRAPANGLDHLGQDVHGAAPVIELAAAVVGHVHTLDAVVARQRRVLGGRDALENERDVVKVLEALHVVPAERGLELVAAGARAPRLDEPPRQVALASAVHGGVDGEAERGVAVVLGALDVAVYPGVVAADVELEDAGVVGRRGHGLEAGVADRAQHL